MEWSDGVARGFQWVFFVMPGFTVVLSNYLPLALAGYMSNKDYGSLNAMYTLFTRVKATKALNAAFGNHVRVCTITKSLRRVFDPHLFYFVRPPSRTS